MITSVQYIKWQASSSARGFSDDFFSVNNSYDYEEKNCYFLSLCLFLCLIDHTDLSQGQFSPLAFPGLLASRSGLGLPGVQKQKPPELLKA